MCDSKQGSSMDILLFGMSICSAGILHCMLVANTGGGVKNMSISYLFQKFMHITNIVWCPLDLITVSSKKTFRI